MDLTRSRSSIVVIFILSLSPIAIPMVIPEERTMNKSAVVGHFGTLILGEGKIVVISLPDNGILERLGSLTEIKLLSHRD